MKEQTHPYLKEKFPKRFYTKRFILKDTKWWHVSWSEILITLFIILMMLTLFINSQP